MHVEVVLIKIGSDPSASISLGSIVVLLLAMLRKTRQAISKIARWVLKQLKLKSSERYAKGVVWILLTFCVVWLISFVTSSIGMSALAKKLTTTQKNILTTGLLASQHRGHNPNDLSLTPDGIERSIIRERANRFIKQPAALESYITASQSLIQLGLLQDKPYQWKPGSISYDTPTELTLLGKKVALYLLEHDPSQSLPFSQISMKPSMTQ